MAPIKVLSGTIYRAILALTATACIGIAAANSETNQRPADVDHSPLESESFAVWSKNLLDAKGYTEQFANFEKRLSEYEGDVFDVVFPKSMSPIPSVCTSRVGSPPAYVLTKTKVALVRERRGSSYKGYFDVQGFVLLDKNRDGIPEAYGFGLERSSMGASIGPIHSVKLENSREDLIRNFKDGLTIIPWLSPTLFIDLRDWSCRTLHDSNGNIAAK